MVKCTAAIFFGTFNCISSILLSATLTDKQMLHTRSKECMSFICNQYKQRQALAFHPDPFFTTNLSKQYSSITIFNPNILLHSLGVRRVWRRFVGTNGGVLVRNTQKQTNYYVMLCYSNICKEFPKLIYDKYYETRMKVEEIW